MLEAGLELFGERGYHATSIAEIGLWAGIAKSVLYHYFGSKAGLYEEIATAQTRDLLAAVAEAVPADPDAPRLRAGVDAYLSFLAGRRAAWRLFLRDPPLEPALVALHDRLARETEESLSHVLTQRAKRGRAQPHAGLVATAIRTFTAWWFDHPEVPREHVVDAIMDVAAAAGRHIERAGPAAASGH